MSNEINHELDASLDVLKITTINAKNSIVINSSSGTSVGHSNKEWKMEVLKIALL